MGRPPLATVRFAAPGGAERVADIIDKRGEPAPQRLAPSHQHVIVIALRLKGRGGAQRLFQTPADAVALDRAADALGYGQSDAGAERLRPAPSRRRDCRVNVSTETRRPRETR